MNEIRLFGKMFPPQGEVIYLAPVADNPPQEEWSDTNYPRIELASTSSYPRIESTPT